MKYPSTMAHRLRVRLAETPDPSTAMKWLLVIMIIDEPSRSVNFPGCACLRLRAGRDEQVAPLGAAVRPVRETLWTTLIQRHSRQAEEALDLPSSNTPLLLNGSTERP